MRDKIIEDYKILLSIGWLEDVEGAGNVSLVIGDDVRPATIDGKRVVLPTREQMKNNDWTNRIGFHPLRESYNLGISDVLANLRDQYVMRLNASISYFMKELIGIAFDQANQKNLTTEQSQVLNCLPNVTARTVSDFDDLLKKTKSRNDAEQFINIFIKRGGTVKGQTYGRAAIVTFPVYKALKDHQEKINGVKFSVKDRDMLINLFEFVFPTIADSESFNVGISSKTAPFLESLVRSTFNVVDQLVESAHPYMDIVAIPTLLTFPENMGLWKEIFDSKDLAEKMQRSIPNLSTGEEEEVKAKDDKPVYKARDTSPATSAPTKSLEERITPAPRGRMILGGPAPSHGESLGKSQPGQSHDSTTDRAERSTIGAFHRAPRRESELEREEQRRKLELEDRERRAREREEQEERRRRDEDESRYRRERDTGRDSRYRDDRERDDRDRRDYRDDRDYRERDGRDGRERTGDPFSDNPVLRSVVRDEEDRGRYDSRDRYDRGRDPRDRRDGRDLRDRDRGRYRDDRDRYDERDRGRYRR